LVAKIETQIKSSKKTIGKYNKYLYEGSPFANMLKVKRTCLRCHKSFKAYGKFNRVCKPCKDKNERQHMDDYVTPGHSRQ